MDLKTAMSLPLGELRAAYREYLQRKGFKKVTAQTSSSDAFLLLRKAGAEEFWNIVASDAFDQKARVALENAIGDPSISGYYYHLNKFRQFIFDETDRVTAAENGQSSEDSSQKNEPPRPSVEQVELYLDKWKSLDNYQMQEKALDRLFLTLCKNNTDISDILLKVVALNDFYSTNIFSVYSVANHIKGLKDVDARLKAGEISLVNEMQKVTIKGKEKNFYSFATKYCSHHNPEEYPIYDSYVDKVLCRFRSRDTFAEFSNQDLKDYNKFKDILLKFRKYYGLEKYNLKDIDKYLWLLGKEFYPHKYYR